MKSPNDRADFPTPLERDLPPGRHLRLKEHLLSEIRQENQESTTAVPSAGGRGWLRPSLVAGAVVAAVAAGLVVAQPFGGDAAQAGPPSKETVRMLERIADAAKRQQSVPKGIEDDQFVYIKSKVSFRDGGKQEALHDREIWLSVDGKHTEMLHEPANDANYERLEDEVEARDENGDPVEPKPYEAATNYRNLQKLPTDPVNMLDWLNRVSKEETNGKPFVLLGDMVMESLMPPEQAAAMYLAATKIPGVELVDDVEDAAGRHGVAITWEDDGDDVRTELIFDKKTKQYLGTRAVLTEDGSHGKEGEVTESTAVVDREVVDKAGERP
ncbi:CU044_5270 family protein [Streptomyces sp. NRRL B-1347]|uniref:CU044_5270 family protein n=1 Tax=Streptomyces sp. NRRL B-1347 TaxID=1476877 RepID=UPI000689FF9F|nr:CU044_5270 family protein [Streptomyces sp. NRRL B-1347]